MDEGDEGKMSVYNWISKFDAMSQEVRDIAVTQWEFAFGVACFAALMSAIIAAKNPETQEKFKRKSRIFRYCGDCPHCDLITETCAVDAAQGEKCGLVCCSSGMTFTVTKH